MYAILILKLISSFFDHPTSLNQVRNGGDVGGGDVGGCDVGGGVFGGGDVGGGEIL